MGSSLCGSKPSSTLTGKATTTAISFHPGRRSAQSRHVSYEPSKTPCRPIRWDQVACDIHHLLHASTAFRGLLLLWNRPFFLADHNNELFGLRLPTTDAATKVNGFKLVCRKAIFHDLERKVDHDSYVAIRVVVAFETILFRTDPAKNFIISKHGIQVLAVNTVFDMSRELSTSSFYFPIN